MRTAILGGHVIDPANRVDGKLNLVMENGKIVWAGREKPDADRIIDVSGLVVTPGFIDIHMHEDPVSGGKIRQSIFHMALSMGVTTDLGGNCGINVYDPAAYLDLVDRDGGYLREGLRHPAGCHAGGDRKSPPGRLCRCFLWSAVCSRGG